MTKIEDSLPKTIMKKVENSEKQSGVSKRESDKLKQLDSLIEKEEILELQKYDFRENILEVIYADSDGKNGDKHVYAEDYESKKIGDSDVLKKTAFGKKWAGKNKIDFDYDCSNLSAYVFAKSILRQYSCEYIDRNTAYGVKIQSGEVWFSGDTMNSWTTTLNKFGELYGKEYLKDECVETKNVTWIERFSETGNYRENKQLPTYITEFFKAVYTMGNFIPVPDGFNEARSKSTEDYWDLTLLLIYKWYHSPAKENECNLKDFYLQRLVCEQENISHCKRWLNLFGDWNAFVKQNYMQPFVKQLKSEKGEQYGEPLELWDGHFNGGTLPYEEWQFEQFFVNARIRILWRGELIAKDLIKNEKEDANDEKRSD